MTRCSSLISLLRYHYFPDSLICCQIIAFFFEFLQQEKRRGADNRVLLIPPAVTFLMIHGDEGYAESILQPLAVNTFQLVLFAVNNNQRIDSANQGSHWSLLAYDRELRKLIHYDSCRGMNTDTARILSDKIVGKRKTIIDENVPQQSNGYDCGIHVLVLAEQLYVGGEINPLELQPAKISAFRRSLLQLMQNKIDMAG
jgi:sentrin-specific protease 8